MEGIRRKWTEWVERCSLSPVLPYEKVRVDGPLSSPGRALQPLLL